MLKNFRLAIKFLWREWRAGEWLIVSLALFFAVAAVTAMHFFTDRIMRGIELQSSRLLGGDLVISSQSPILKKWRHQAKLLNLRTADVWIYPSMVSTNNQSQLVNIEAVSHDFPLIGDTSLRPNLGTVHIEHRVFSMLGIKSNDKVRVGAASFIAKDRLISQMDTLNTTWIFAPRLMMRIENIPVTRTVLPGSKVNYRLLIVGEKKYINEFIAWLTPQLTSEQKIITAQNQQEMLQTIFLNTQNYLQLTLIICLIMSGVVIMISIREYIRRHFSHVALWRCLGAKKYDVIQIFLWQLFIIATLTGFFGIVAGFIVQMYIADAIKDMLPFTLPVTTSFTPVYLGFLTSTFILFTIAYPIIVELPDVSPLILWQHKTTSITQNSTPYFLIFLLLFLLFVNGLMGFSLLALFMTDVFLIAIGFFYLVSLLMIFLIRIISRKTEGVVLRGLSQLFQHVNSVSLQFIGFSLIITLLIVLSNVRTDLISTWQKSLPASTPNYFAINIAPYDVENLKILFQKNAFAIEDIYPITKGRLIAINQRPVLEVVPENARGNNALHRELNLSWMWKFPSDNKIIAGSEWPPKNTRQLFASVEEKLAINLGLHLSDELTFQMGEQQITAKIINFRRVEWNSFHPNFFIIFTPGFLEHFPTTYIASFYLDSTKTQFINKLVQQFPNMTIIDIANILSQVQTLIEKISLIIQYLFLFTLGIGILIFITSLSASLDERRHTYSLLKILGASQSYIYKSIAVEFFTLGLIIICSSVILANIITTILMKNLF